MLGCSLLKRRIASRAQVADGLSSDSQGWIRGPSTGCAHRNGCLGRITAASRIFATVFGVGECVERQWK